MNVSVEREKSTYFLLVDMGQFVPTLKFDTGSEYTVISAGMLGGVLSSDQLADFKNYCETHSSRKEKFISASGDSIYGYPVTAHDSHGNFVITAFDEEGYSIFTGAMQNDEVIAYMDSLSEKSA